MTKYCVLWIARPRQLKNLLDKFVVESRPSISVYHLCSPKSTEMLKNARSSFQSYCGLGEEKFDPPWKASIRNCMMRLVKGCVLIGTFTWQQEHCRMNLFIILSEITFLQIRSPQCPIVELWTYGIDGLQQVLSWRNTPPVTFTYCVEASESARKCCW